MAADASEGGNFGATLIDRAFLRWAKDHITNLPPNAGNQSQRGTYVLSGVERDLLISFDDAKHTFTGTDEFSRMTVPRTAVLTPEAAAANDRTTLRIPL